LFRKERMMGATVPFGRATPQAGQAGQTGQTGQVTTAGPP
jgi:hypothetical protein